MRERITIKTPIIIAKPAAGGAAHRG